MKYALIGCGRIAANHIKAVISNNLNLCAVCDVQQDNMKTLLAKYYEEQKDIVQYTNYKELIREQHPQLVAIATESGAHAEIALYCIKHGVNVIIEKPIAMSIDDADKIIKTGIEYNVKVCVCHQNRFNSAVQELHKALEKGRFGKLSHASVNIRWNRNEDYYKQALWRGTWAHDGGALMNQCIHGIDLLRWMLGNEITEVYGATRRQQHEYIQAEDIGVAVLKCANGALATIEGTTNVYPKNLEETLYLFGENGTVKLGGTSCNNIDVWDFSNEDKIDIENKVLKEETSNVYGNGHTLLYKDMIEAITDNREPYVNAKAGRDALEIVLAIYKSQKTGQPIKLPLSGFTTMDMCNEF